MIDLTEQINDIENENFDNALENIKYEQEILIKKEYILKALKVIKELKQLSSHNEVKDNKITEAEFLHVIDSSNQKNYICCICFCKNGEEYNPGCAATEMEKEIITVLKPLEGYPDEYVSNEFCFERIRVPFTEEGFEELKGHFLSEELLRSLNYAIMDNDLPNEHKSQSKKFKV